jgi:hypothetical protein
MNVNVISSLDYIERRGTLTYFVGSQVRIEEGHYQLSRNGANVIRRKIRGRNRYNVCSVVNVIRFAERTEIR